MVLSLSLDHAALRPVIEADAADIQQCCNDAQLADDLGGTFPNPYTFAHASEFVKFAAETDAKGYHDQLAITLNNQLVGMVGLVNRPKGSAAYAELGYWVGAAFRGRGLASAAIDAFSRYVFETFAEINRIEAVIFEQNMASRRALEKAGYTFEARLKGRARQRNGQITDDLMFARLRLA